MSLPFRKRALVAALPCFALSLLASPAHADDSTTSKSGDSGNGSSIATVTVTGSPLSQDANDLATVVDSVDEEQILRAGGSSLADALKNVPGVTGTGFAAGASRPVIRGFDATRVLVLENGIDSFDVSDIGPDHGVPIDPLTAQRIEVVRGAGTLRYGSQALGGVVNSINNRIPTSLPDLSFSGDVTGSLDSVDNGRDGSAQLDGRVGDLALHADGFARHTDDYDTPHGTQDNSFFHGDGYSGGGSYFFGQDKASHIGGTVVRYDAKYGIPSDTTYIDMTQTKEMLNGTFAVNSGPLQTITVDGGYANYHHSEDNPDGSVNSTFRNKAWEGRAEALFGQMGFLSRSALGIQSEGRSFSAIGEDSSYLFPTNTHTNALFAFSEAPLTDALKLQAGARVESDRVDGTPSTDHVTNRNFTPVSGSLSLLAEASQTVHLGLTVSSTGRAPAQTELYARGGHDGPDTFETGDPSLDIERSNSLEGTIRVDLQNVKLVGSVWGAKIHNYVFGDLTGRTCDDDGVCTDSDDGELRELNYTQLDATFRGAEAQANFAVYDGPAGKLGANLLADYVRATLDHGGNVPRIPPYHVGGGVDWSLGGVDAGVSVKYAGAQHDTGEYETNTKGYTELDAQVGWKPFATDRGVEIAVIGHNLTDSVQRDAVALNKDSVLMPGRDVRLLLRASF
ncbi:TonB-dependent receptor [Solimonas marina]|uniref:TonB-dependent receptor n=1 Tax=Solimonas marina TaxID=2714601 RepID=A0A969WC47_9GAMM|nr:TonB-dependent receptor [Solimonas marina]NKF23819.1 TonB-dependent receptor [Solimonas marina]